MATPLPLIPQANKPYDLIDLERWNRSDSFEFFMSCGTQIHLSASVCYEGVDAYLRQHDLKRFSTILYLLWRCANEVQAMRISAAHHPREDDPRLPVLFPELDIAFPVLDREEIPKNTLVKLDGSFKVSYERITAAIEAVRSGTQENVFADGHACLLASSIPFAFNDIEMTSIHRHMLIPTVFVGNPHTREGKEVLPVALSVHHALADGMDMVLFFQKLESYFANPEAVLGS